MSGNWLKRIALVCMTPEVDAQERSETLPSYGIHRIQAAIVANPAFANTEVRIIDLGSEDDDSYVQELLRFRPQLIGYSLFVWSTNCLVKVARNLRKLDPSVVQVFGGPSARSALLDLTPYAPAYQYADCLVIRDGEEAFNQIAMSLNELQDRTRTIKALESIGGVEIPTPIGWYRSALPVGLGKMDHLPSPYQMGLMRYGAFGYLETFRGCPMSCRFCEWGMADVSQGCFSEDYLTRELEALAGFAPQAVFDVDSGLNLNERAFKELARASEATGYFRNKRLICEVYPAKIQKHHMEFMSQVGEPLIGVGLQSFDKTTLSTMERTLEEEKFDVHIAEMTRFAHVAIEIIMGLPGDTPETFRKTFWRARSYPCTLRVYHCVVLPSALMVRSPPEHLLNYDPSSLKMRSCLGWTAEAIEQECRFLSTIAEQSGGAIGEFLWVFPPP